MAQRTIAPDDLFRFHFLQGARLSPDGAKVVYALTRVDTDADKEYVDLWLHDLSSGDTRRLTGGDYRDGAPEWSPDGKTIAFTSSRGDKAQIYLLPVDGGEAQKLTDLKQGAGAPVWSPDGTQDRLHCGAGLRRGNAARSQQGCVPGAAQRLSL